MNEEVKPTAENFDTIAEAANEQEIAERQPANAAAALMKDPAAAAGLTAAPTPQVLIQRTLEALPGLVGAIDHAIKDQTGKHQPFVLLIFAEGTALHSANFDPKVAQKAIIELAGRWDTGDEAVVVNGNTPAGDIPRGDTGRVIDAEGIPRGDDSGPVCSGGACLAAGGGTSDDDHLPGCPRYGYKDHVTH